MKVDILAFGAHPDDVELGAGATIAKEIANGKTVAIVDLTKGELGTRGTAITRQAEAEEAKNILGVSYRENLGFADCFFENDKQHQLEVIKMIRKYQPDIVICNAIDDRHFDHGKASKLVSDACFLSALNKIKTELNGIQQKQYRPKHVYHYIQWKNIEPDFVVDVSDFIDVKIKSVLA
ncbi:MAG: bacillithiol biosynthesis deacetylase BshB1, partial [Olleya sp.]